MQTSQTTSPSLPSTRWLIAGLLLTGAAAFFSVGLLVNEKTNPKAREYIVPDADVYYTETSPSFQELPSAPERSTP